MKIYLKSFGISVIILVAVLIISQISYGAPTSTIVQNLFIKDVTSKDCAGTNSAGLIIEGTCTGGSGSGSISTSSNLVAGQWVVASAYNTVYSTTSLPLILSQVNSSGTIIQVVTSTTGGLTIGVSVNPTFTNLTATNVSTTNISASGYGLFPTLAFTSASGTNLTASGYLQSASGFITSVSSTDITVTGYGTFPTLNSPNAALTSVSSTNITASGYIHITGNNLFDAAGTKYQTSSVGALLIANNLSDVANVSSSLVNLRLSTSSLVTFGSLVATTYDPQGNKYVTSTSAGSGTLTTSTPYVANALLYTTTATGNAINSTSGISVLSDGTVSSTAQRIVSGTIGTLYDFQGIKYVTSTGSGTISTSSNLVAGQWVVASAYNTVYSTTSLPLILSQVNSSGTIIQVVTSTTGGLTIGVSVNPTFTNLTATNVSTTNISASGYGLFPTLAFTSASGTNLTASGYLQSASGFITSVSSTDITVTGYGTFPTLNSHNAALTS